MEDILKQFYDGEIFPAEQIDLMDKDFQSKNTAYHQAITEFCKTLNQMQKEAFEKLQNIQNENDFAYNILHFKKGFQLGMQLTLAGLEIPHIKPTT